MAEPLTEKQLAQIREHGTEIELALLATIDALKAEVCGLQDVCNLGAGELDKSSKMEGLEAELSREREKVKSLQDEMDINRRACKMSIDRERERADAAEAATEGFRAVFECAQQRADAAEKREDEAVAVGVDNVAKARHQERQRAAEIVRSVGLGLCTYCEKHPIHYTCGLRLLIIKRILEGQPEGEGQQEKRETILSAGHPLALGGKEGTYLLPAEPQPEKGEGDK